MITTITPFRVEDIPYISSYGVSDYTGVEHDLISKGIKKYIPRYLYRKETYAKVTIYYLEIEAIALLAYYGILDKKKASNIVETMLVC